MEERNIDETILKALIISYTTLNVKLTDDMDEESCRKFITAMLFKFRQGITQKNVPISLLEERKYLEDRIARSKSNYVQADSFGDGMPHAQSDPRSLEKEHERRIGLENRLDAVNEEINKYQESYDDNVRDGIKFFIDLVPNDKHRDVMLLFYIHHYSYRYISIKTYYSEETAISYRKRGIRSLADTLYSFLLKSSQNVKKCTTMYHEMCDNMIVE